MKNIVKLGPSIVIIIMILAMIFGFSTQTGDESSDISQKITQIVQDRITQYHGEPERSDHEVELIVRKFAHFLEYFFYGVAVLMIMRNLLKKFYFWLPLSLLMTIPIPFIDEFVIQVQSPGRTPMLMDVGIDLLGVGVALIAFIFFAMTEIRD